MPIFRTTHNILKAPWEGDIFDENWMNYDTIQTPPSTPWDYSRELQIEDVDVWEVIVEGNAGVGVYAAWSPYAEFYLVTSQEPLRIETFYGKGAQKRLKNHLDSVGIKCPVHTVWVDEDEMYLYE
jgi:hypothetical protein